ncbi:hypothetical protein GFS31_44080 (plasmid) [Leptolyngbya sp. BL0902]|nr:hypothetical protein GFS31_44080 [Leptolyngbya sp. BL0902]
MLDTVVKSAQSQAGKGLVTAEKNLVVRRTIRRPALFRV